VCEAENLCDDWCYISIVPESLGSIKSVQYIDKFALCKTDFLVHTCSNVTLNL
jgi:hypothetical protein